MIQIEDIGSLFKVIHSINMFGQLACACSMPMICDDREGMDFSNLLMFDDDVIHICASDPELVRIITRLASYGDKCQSL